MAKTLIILRDLSVNYILKANFVPAKGVLLDTDNPNSIAVHAGDRVSLEYQLTSNLVRVESALGSFVILTEFVSLEKAFPVTVVIDLENFDREAVVASFMNKLAEVERLIQ